MGAPVKVVCPQINNYWMLLSLTLWRRWN